MQNVKSRGVLLGFDLAIILIMLAVTLTLTANDKRHNEAHLRRDLLDQGQILSGYIASEMSKRVVIANTMAASIAEFPNISDEQYRSIAESFRSDKPDIINVAYSRDMIVTRIHPIKGNEAVLGADLRNRPEFVGGIERALRTKQTVLAGPVDLIQGGTGFILRAPVVRRNSIEPPNEILSIVIDANAFLRASGLTVGIDGAKVAVVRETSQSGSPALIAGDPGVFSMSAVSIPIDTGLETWRLGLAPATGWPTQGDNVVVIWSVAISTTVLALLILHRLHSLRTSGETARRQLMDAIEAIDDGFALYDADDRFVMCNSKYRSIYDKSADLFVPGRTFREIIKAGIERGQYPDSVGREEEWLEERMRVHAEASDPVEQRLSDGTWLRVSERKTTDGGTVGFRVDVTELKLARDAAEAANRATTQFLNNINHEIRTPLTVMVGFNAFLAEPERLSSHKELVASLADPCCDKADIGAKVTAYIDETRGYATRVQTSAQHLMDLVNETLDLAKIQNGRLNLQLEEVDVAPLLAESVEQFSTQARQKGLTLIADGESAVLWADRMRLRQVMINLIGNAVKFTEEGHIHVTSTVADGKVRIAVSDTGPGIPKKYLSQIFEKFWQADGSETRKQGGTGLGLAISRELVELQGGQIVLERSDTSGCTFAVYFSLSETARKIPNDETCVA